MSRVNGALVLFGLAWLLLATLACIGDPLEVFVVSITNKTDHAVQVTIWRMKPEGSNPYLRAEFKEKYALEPGKNMEVSWSSDARGPFNPVQVQGYANGKLIFCQEYQPGASIPNSASRWSVEILDGQVSCQPLGPTPQPPRQ